MVKFSRSSRFVLRGKPKRWHKKGARKKTTRRHSTKRRKTYKRRK